MREFLGEGGKKRVFVAHDTSLDRDVAFALIRTEGLDATGRERVAREAQAMGRLGAHPHLVTIHDIGEESGQPYIVMEHMAQGSLATRPTSSSLSSGRPRSRSRSAGRWTALG